VAKRGERKKVRLVIDASVAVKWVIPASLGRGKLKR